MKTWITWTGISIITLMLVVGCGDEDNGGGPPMGDLFDRISFEFYSSAPLPSGLTYELWAHPLEGLAAHEDEWVSIQRFNLRASDSTMIDAQGALISGNTLDSLDLDFVDFDSLYVTVEPTTGDAPEPSGVIYLRGAVPNLGAGFRIAALSFLTPNLVNDADSLSQFTFTTPTDNVTNNELSGVWFMTPAFTRGLLTLRTPPTGWIYEGWAILPRGASTHYVSTGRFNASTGPDQSNAHGGSLAAPLFPGEDLLNPVGTAPFPVVFQPGDSIWITLEPAIDPLPGQPFPFLVFNERSSLVPDTLQPFRLRPHPASIPIVQATIGESE